ncbi:serine/threonine-protein kinase/endoribonuclease IRE1-like [Daphnia pulex]|uniref:serine/threonine-protein kinase/endoribonuclease IRE1-like n=1 Tax=Daphnia pulex TaxID=6669 RepID=UPI001EDCD016|nr:serine/threonine-protein kinase/endoribonuclease IRE1-like [Daphnia pulex]
MTEWLNEGTQLIDFEIYKGVGGFATVFEGTLRDGVKVAVKRIVVGDAATNEQEEKALKMLNHPNVIKLFHVEEDLDFKMFALELCDASLDQLFLKEKDPKKYSGPMPPQIEVLLQLAKGLEYIHQMGLVHRDIKPHNVLIRLDSTTQRVVMKWADFGLSKKVNERGTFTMSGVRGTHDYFAPEILKLLDDDQIATDNEDKKRGTVQSDVFAEGLVFGYFLSRGVHPFGTTSHQIQNNLRTNEPANLPSKSSESLLQKLSGIETTNIQNTITRMLEKDPNNRITSSDVVNRLTEIILKNSQQLFTLIAKGNPIVEEIEKLIQEGLDVNAKDEKGLTPLLHLVKSEKISENLVKIFILLIQHGANVNSLDSNGENALLLWCKNREQYQNKSFLTILNLFVKNGIDINCKDKYENNVLILLCRSYRIGNLIDIIRLLIKNGIDVNGKNIYRNNALTILGFKVTKETRDYFQRNYEEKNRDEILQLLHV